MARRRQISGSQQHSIDDINLQKEEKQILNCITNRLAIQPCKIDNNKKLITDHE